MLGFATFKVSSFSIFNVFLFPVNGPLFFFGQAQAATVQQCNSATVKEAKAIPTTQCPTQLPPTFICLF